MRRLADTSAETGTTTSTHGDEEHLPEYISFGVLVLALSVGIFTRVTIAKWIPIPYTVLLLIWGGIFGIWYTETTNRDPFNQALNNSINTWLTMDPRVLQIIFLPILIFASAFNAQFHILERRLGQIIFLALPGVILGAVLTASYMKYVLPYGWDWNLSLVFGSMVAATDPVAVVALLEELGVSEKLGTLIEGESLFNDGSAIVVFEVFLESVEGIDRTWYEVLEFGVRLALGGPAVGALIGLAGAFVLGYVINDPLVEVSITVVLSFCTFALCEATDVKVSGVLGVVALGVILSYYGRPRVSSSVLPSLRDFWRTLQFFADTTIFFLSGLIVVGVAISSDRAIAGRDWGYLLGLFVVLYIIRGIVVLLAYPVLRSGEYKITVPQMIVLTHSGLRGAVALILALVVDAVPDIPQEDRDKIVFHTAGIAVLSLLVNGTTTGVLVRLLKLDRVSAASESVFDNACFALEMSLEKEQLALKENRFLADANWPLVWRYIPLFNADSYWHRLSKGHIVLSQVEVEDVLNANNRADSCLKLSLWKRLSEALRRSKGGFYYRSIPHRLRGMWYQHNRSFKFEDAGGESVWGRLETFLTNHSAGDDHGEAWTGHLKHSRSHIGELEDTVEIRERRRASRVFPEEKVASLVGQDDGASDLVQDEADIASGDASSRPVSWTNEDEVPKEGEVLDLTEGFGTQGDGNEVSHSSHHDVSFGFAISHVIPAAIDQSEASEASAANGEGDPDGPQPSLIEEFSNSSMADMDDDRRMDLKDELLLTEARQGLLMRSVSQGLFQRAASVARHAGLNLEAKQGEGELNVGELHEARLRFLGALKAEYVKAKREGKLGSGGLRVLQEAIHSAMDKAENGQQLDSWSELSGHFERDRLVGVAKYLNWWPARPIAAAAIARHLSFQLELAWNFLEAHHETNYKNLFQNDGEVSKVQRTINAENQAQIDLVEKQVFSLTLDTPLVTRSVMTRTAARVMIQRYRESMELLVSNGLIDEKEEEMLMTAVTDAELKIAYHPNLEDLPPLETVLERVEFLLDLSPENRQRLIDVGAAYYQQYVGEVTLIERGKRNVRRGASKDRDFSGWFYVVRGNVEKETKLESGELLSRTHSAGLLFGITDTMLGVPHHAGYTTHGFSNLIVFDRAKLSEEAENMPELDKSLWASVGAHSLRRSERFHRFKLSSCHGLMDRSTLLSGKKGENEEETLELADGEAIVLVRGKIISSDGFFGTCLLGQPDGSIAPVMLENRELFGARKCTLRLSGNYKALLLHVKKLRLFLHEERDRLSKQATMRRRSMSMSAMSDRRGSADVGLEDCQVQSTKDLPDGGAGGKRTVGARGRFSSAAEAREVMRVMAGH